MSLDTSRRSEHRTIIAMRPSSASLAILTSAVLLAFAPGSACGQPASRAAGEPPAWTHLADRDSGSMYLDTLAARIAGLELWRLELQSDSGLLAHHHKVVASRRTLEALWARVAQLRDAGAARARVQTTVVRALDARLAHLAVEEVALVAGGAVTAGHGRVQRMRSQARLLAERRAELLRVPGAAGAEPPAPPR